MCATRVFHSVVFHSLIFLADPRICRQFLSLNGRLCANVCISLAPKHINVRVELIHTQIVVPQPDYSCFDKLHAAKFQQIGAVRGCVV